MIMTVIANNVTDESLYNASSPWELLITDKNKFRFSLLFFGHKNLIQDLPIREAVEKCQTWAVG